MKSAVGSSQLAVAVGNGQTLGCCFFIADLLFRVGVRRNTQYLTHCHFERSREVFY